MKASNNSVELVVAGGCVSVLCVSPGSVGRIVDLVPEVLSKVELECHILLWEEKILCTTFGRMLSYKPI